MFKKMLFLVLIGSVLFIYRGSPEAMGFKDDEDDIIPSPTFTGTVVSDQTSQNQEIEDIEKELKQLLEDVKKLEKRAKKKLQKELLPHIKREIEKLRKWLRELQPEDDEPGPQKTRKTRNHEI